MGVVIVAVCALGVVVWHQSTSASESVLVLASAIRAGETLTADALRREDAHIGAGVEHVRAADAATVIGKVAGADLVAGTLVSAALFAGRPPVPAGSSVVAAALQPGQFATFQLRPGQAVRALRADASAVAIVAATVYEVRALADTNGTWIVSLLVPDSAAPAVAAAAAAKTLSLALVGGPDR